MPSPDEIETRELAPERSFGERLKRALARRFPRVRIVYNLARAHLPGQLRRLRPRRVRATWRWAADTWRLHAARRREPRLTVGVDVASFWEPLTGVGWYLYRLVEHLASRDDLRLRLYGPSGVWSPDLPAPVVEIPSGPAIERVLLEIPDDLLVPQGLLIRLLRRLEPVLIAADSNEVLFAPNYFLPRRFHLADGARVATIHDLGVLRVPWTLRPETLGELGDRLDHALLGADRLITVSAAVREELVEMGLSGRDRVEVVHHGPGQLARVEPGRLPEGVPRRYGLHVGTLEPRKNILGLLEAWRELRRLVPKAPPLVLSGRFGWKTREIRREVERAANEGWVIHLGYVEESELAALYRGAAVVVFPSLYEGFGLPAVEAQWADAPLVASDLPVLREVAGDGALYADGGDPKAIAAAVARVLTDPKLAEGLREAGRRRVAEFSWERSAERTAGVFREAAGRGRRDGEAA